MRKLLIAALPAVLALALAPVALSKPVPTLPSIDGAVFTSVDLHDSNYPNECKNGNPAVNCNQYTAKQYVFLNGGPTRNHLSPDGVYFFAVLSPSGQANPVDGSTENLSDDYDCYLNREFVIKNGEVDSVLKSTDTNCFKSPSALPVGTPHLFDDPFVQLAPYADTTNPGGVYIMAVCWVASPATTPTAPIALADPANVSPSKCKYDAFKVQVDNTPPVCKLISKTATSISVAVQDVGSGLESVDVTTSNANASFPNPLQVGSADPFWVNATKIDTAAGATLKLVVTDVAGNQLTCDPVYGQPSIAHRATVRAGGRATILGLRAADSKLTLSPAKPGARTAIVSVNHRRFAVVALHGGRVIGLDLRSALAAHHLNTVSVTVVGQRGALVARISSRG